MRVDFADVTCRFPQCTDLKATLKLPESSATATGLVVKLLKEWGTNFST